jgi:hypothetical protein
MTRDWSDHHWHLLEHAPDLVVWAMARHLPLDRLHEDARTAGSPDWERLDDETPALTRLTAERLVMGYGKVRRKVHSRAEVKGLAKWHEILRAAEVC